MSFGYVILNMPWFYEMCSYVRRRVSKSYILFPPAIKQYQDFNVEGKRRLGRPMRRWVDNIKMDLREIGWDVMDWIDLDQDRDQWRALVNTVMNLRVP
jgi:hypothetical protein